MKTLQGVTFIKEKNPDRTKQTEVNKKSKIQTKNTHQNKQLESVPESFEKRCHRYYANHSSVHFFGVIFKFCEPVCHGFQFYFHFRTILNRAAINIQSFVIIKASRIMSNSGLFCTNGCAQSFVFYFLLFSTL